MSEARAAYGVESNHDRIHIRDLRLRCRLGTHDEERAAFQEVLLSITLYVDLGDACRSDDLKDTVDYYALQMKVTESIEKRSFQLVERLADAVAEICLAQSRVERVDVMVDKPGALNRARSVAVELVRIKRE